MLPLLIAAQGPKFPSPVVPDGWGVNIHFTDGRPGEAAKIARAFRWARMDFMWHTTEREKGKYDFAAYDRLVASLKRAGVRPYFILDYGNDLYEKGSPRTPESRAAFCRWVAALMARYKGRGYVWEMWNEPNISFWQPKPDVEQYVLLARQVGETIRRVAPGETYVGPATSGFDWPFLQRCLDAGLLKYWDAVSVHPYRQNEPESAAEDWLRLRAMIDRAGGRGKPMLSGEWGYSELYSGQSKAKQAQMIARAYLTNLSCGVPISIWYDWKDDGTDPKETEHHFGAVSPDLADKPAFAAAARLARDLAGFGYVTRLHTIDPDQWLLLFRRGKEARVAAWTTGEPSMASLPGFRFRLEAAPRIVRGPSLASLLAWKAEPWYRMVEDAPRPEDRGFALASGTRDRVRGFDGLDLVQRTHLIPRRELDLTVVPKRDGTTEVRVENPYRRRMKGLVLRFVSEKGAVVRSMPALSITREGVPVPASARVVRLASTDDPVGVVRAIPRFVPLSLVGATAAADGDAKVRASVSSVPGADGTTLAYDFDQGWRYAELRLPGGRVEGKPHALGMWVLGNGTGDLLRMRYADATGQTFQPDHGPIDWRGWRYVTFKLNGLGGRWGGANDGQVHYPIRVTALALVDMPGGRGGKGAITVARPVLAYGR